MGAVGDGAEMAIDVWYQLIHQDFLELCPVKLVHATKLTFVCHTISHDNDERLYFAFCYEIVENKVGMSLVCPCCLVLSPSMLQIKHRVTVFLSLFADSAFFISSRCIDVGDTLGIGAWRMENNLLHIAMRDILERIEVAIMCRNLYTRLPTA